MAMILCNIAGNSRLFWSHELSSFFSLSFFAPKYGEGNDTKKMPIYRNRNEYVGGGGKLGVAMQLSVKGMRN